MLYNSLEREVYNPYSLKGKVAVITGASGLIGQKICRELAAQGADIIATYHNNNETLERLKEVKNYCHYSTPHIMAVPGYKLHYFIIIPRGNDHE